MSCPAHYFGAYLNLGSTDTSLLSRPGYDHFREVVWALREYCPPGKPVIIRTAKLAPTTLGECVRRPSRFVIRLNSRLGQLAAVEVLCHEWAHSLAWNFTLDRLAKHPAVSHDEFQHASHDEAWGCAYSRVWRVYVDLCRGEGNDQARSAAKTRATEPASGYASPIW